MAAVSTMVFEWIRFSPLRGSRSVYVERVRQMHRARRTRRRACRSYLGHWRVPVSVGAARFRVWTRKDQKQRAETLSEKSSGACFRARFFFPSRNGAAVKKNCLDLTIGNRSLCAEEEEEFVLNLFIKFKKMTSPNRSERVYVNPLYARGESAINRIASIFFDAPCTTSNPTRRVPLGHVNRSFFPFFVPPPLKTRLSNVT